MIPPSWSFIVWGLDILGPFPKAIGGYRYLYVDIDKFTKWLEVTPMVKINKKFAIKNARYRQAVWRYHRRFVHSREL
jgi:hypothetical protein